MAIFATYKQQKTMLEKQKHFLSFYKLLLNFLTNSWSQTYLKFYILDLLYVYVLFVTAS